MADLACRCVPANYTSTARLVSGVQSNVNSLAARVTDLETTTADHEDRIEDLESAIQVSESPFTVVDNEAELDAALLTGRHILLRGEGANGVITVTSQKDVTIPGTKIWGYGHNPGSTDHYSKIKANFAALGNFATPFQPIVFNIEASNVEFAGFDLEGRDANDLVSTSYVAFYLSPAHELENVAIRDVTIWNVWRAVAKWGYEGCSATRRFTFERNKVHSIVSSAVGLQQSIYDSRFLNNLIIPRLTGNPNTFVNCQGFTVTADVRDCIFDGNKVENPSRMGFELTSVAHSANTYEPMLRNRIINNTVLNAGSMGISFGFATNGFISHNVIDGAGGIGIENSAGFTLGESNVPHNAVISNNLVNNVSGAGYVSGIIADKTVGDIIEGNIVRDVASSEAGVEPHVYARGVMVYDAKRANVSANQIFETDGIGCYVQCINLSNMDAQAVVQGNNFRVEAAQTKAKYAVYVFDARAVVRNNVAWEPTGGVITQKYETNINLPAVVYPGFAWTADVTGNNLFTESNLRLEY